MDNPSEELTAAQVKKMTVVQLRGQLSARKLSSSGVKKDLVKRLLDVNNQLSFLADHYGLLKAVGLSEAKEETPVPLHVPGDGWPGTVPNVSMRAMGSEVVASYLAQQQAALQSAKKAAAHCQWQLFVYELVIIDAARAASSAEEASDVEAALAVSQAVRSKRGRQIGGKRQKPSAEVVSSTRVLRSQRKQETTDENIQMGGNEHEVPVESFTVVGDVQNESVVKGKIEESPIDVEALPALQPAVIAHKTESNMGPFLVKDSLAAEASKRVMEVKYPSHPTEESMFKDEKEEKEMEQVDMPAQKCSDIFNVDELLKTPTQPVPIVLETPSQGIAMHSDGASKLESNYSPTAVHARDEEKVLARESLTILDSDSETSISADSFTPSPDVPCSDIIVHEGDKFFSQKSVAEDRIRKIKDKEALSTPEETIVSGDTSSEDGMDVQATAVAAAVETHTPKRVDVEHVCDESILVSEADADMDEMEPIDLTTARSPASSEEFEPSREEEDEEEGGDSLQEVFEFEASADKSNDIEEIMDSSSPTKGPAMADEQAAEPKRKWKSSHDFAPSTVISTKVIENLVKSAGQELEVFPNDRQEEPNQEAKLVNSVFRLGCTLFKTRWEYLQGSTPMVAACDTLEQDEASISREKLGQKKTAVSAKVNVDTNALSFDMQWDVLSEVNPELSEAITLRGPVSPTQKHPTKVVRITGLSRPFAVRTLRDTMALFGSFSNTHFWINKIRSVCIVQYDSLESAVNAREALHKVRWPKTNQHFLHVDFGCEGDVEYLNGEGRDDMNNYPLTKARRAGDGRRFEGSESSRSASREDETEYLKDSSPEVDRALDLDNLFKKTKSKPTIYYLPYTKEEAERAEMEREKRRQERIKYLAKDKKEGVASRKVSRKQQGRVVVHRPSNLMEAVRQAKASNLIRPAIQVTIITTIVAVSVIIVVVVVQAQNRVQVVKIVVRIVVGVEVQFEGDGHDLLQAMLIIGGETTTTVVRSGTDIRLKESVTMVVGVKNS
ncbi:RRM 5 and SAP domain containing protein [Trichuris trichiura]|uniref:RRM 5 and SAP domain containing protein n=1 Tax=Trichuris trichiura TaxID=36087 RepID=A0A077Z7C0_TRITR|nr:RRM 5 and SAP domain containing protein [Trichuris trichiura]